MADSTSLPLRYIYKIYTPSGSFLGVLQNVISPFGYNQLINTAGAQLNVVVGVSADVASDNVLVLETEDSLPITTEDSASLTTERTADLVGSYSGGALIANDNLIEVTEYSQYNPTGKVVFSGFISKWKTIFGGDESIHITCLNKGQDLGNYLVPGGTADTLDQSQTTKGVGDENSFWATRRYGQEWTTGAGVTNISALILSLYAGTAGSRTFTVKIWNNYNDATLGGTPLGSASAIVPYTGALVDVTFTFGTPITLTALTKYFYSLEVDSGSVQPDITTWGAVDGKATTSPYANGASYRSDSGGAWSAATLSGYDFYFKTYYSASSTRKTYTSTDPSTILTNIMDYYVASGGAVAEQGGGYALTGKSATYTFNINTVLDGIQKVYELGPSNWYWYVDPATNTLYYKAAATTADHTMIKGRHFKELDIEATKEQIINVVYFTGGDDGSGSNVYVNVNDATSLVNNRRGLLRLNDPKVIGTTGATTGRLLAQNAIDLNSRETYIAQIEVIADTYDISLFDLGEMVAFSGNGNFVDNLLLQIVGIHRMEDTIQLALGTLPLRATQQIESLQSSLNASQTVDNPTSPS